MKTYFLCSLQIRLHAFYSIPRLQEGSFFLQWNLWGLAAKLVDLPFESLKALYDGTHVVYTESLYRRMIIRNRFWFSWRYWVVEPCLLLTICYVEEGEDFENQREK